MIKLKFLQSDKKKQRYGINGVKNSMLSSGFLLTFWGIISIVVPNDLMFFISMSASIVVIMTLKDLHKAEEVHLFQDHFLIYNNLLFWQPKVKFDLEKISRVTFYPRPEDHCVKLIFYLKDGRHRSYNIFDANWEDIINYFHDKGLKLESKV